MADFTAKQITAPSIYIDQGVYSPPAKLVSPSLGGIVKGTKIPLYIMKAMVISDGSERRWSSFGSPDPLCLLAPLAYGLLTNIGIDSVL